MGRKLDSCLLSTADGVAVNSFLIAHCPICKSWSGSAVQDTACGLHGGQPKNIREFCTPANLAYRHPRNLRAVVGNACMGPSQGPKDTLLLSIHEALLRRRRLPALRDTGRCNSGSGPKWPTARTCAQRDAFYAPKASLASARSGGGMHDWWFAFACHGLGMHAWPAHSLR